MTFLVLLLVAVIMWFTPLRRGFPLDLPAKWTEWVHARANSQTPWAAMTLLLLPLPLAGLLVWWVDTAAYGIVSLLVQSLILLCCVGRADPLGVFSPDLSKALDREDLQAASMIAQRDFGLAADNPTDLLVAIRGRMAWEACHSLFVPVFWFVLFGPAAALGYRLLWLAVQREGFSVAGPAGPIVHALEWLPARLMLLSFALVGHYERTLQHFGSVITQWEVSTAQVMTQASNAAVGTEHDIFEAGSLAEVKGLLQRTVLVWAVAIALVVVVG